jgi:hypothetical protein
MKKLIFVFSLFFYISANFSQVFEIKQITSGDFDAKNPFISLLAFWNYPFIYFEKHTGSSSNIGLIEYDLISNSFQEMAELTTGNALRINPYEDFNHGIVFQTNENGNWDIAYRPYENGNWGPITFLTNSTADEYNLSPFYANEPYYPMDNYILFQRSDTIIVLEYSDSFIAEYPVFVNSPQYQYSDYIGIFCFNAPNNYPRMGIHVIAVESDSSGNQSLVYKYKLLNGSWENKNIIKENCKCSNPILQFYEFSPYLIFEDPTSYGVRPFKVFDWDYEKDIDTIPNLVTGDISDFKVDRPDLITLNHSNNFELEYFPHSYFVKNGEDFKIRLNKLESGDIVGDTLIAVHHNTSRIALGDLGIWDGEIFYTIWEDSSAGHIHLFGRRQLYPVGSVPNEDGVNGFVLGQNYPNPFNPSTKIKYQIPASLNPSKGWTLVQLKVYDVLGNEIATLVNEEKPAGEYEVEFNPASGIKYPASGIYFYQLKAGSYIQTKKMVYLK